MHAVIAACIACACTGLFVSGASASAAGARRAVRAASAPSSSRAPAIATPMATALRTADGTWATIPMGRLDEALNTFWQLLYLPPGSSTWRDEVEATATATNGGLVLAAGATGRLVVGIRPSDDLTFTPMIATSDARSWSNGLVDASLVARPAALAAGPGGALLALVGSRSSTRVLTSSGGLSTWKALVSTRALARSGAGRACAVGALTSVAYLGRTALVGASCGRPGVAGVFARQRGAWRLVGPPLRTSGRVEVLSMQSTGDAGTGSASTAVLLAVSRGSSTALIAASRTATGAWSSSAALPVPAGDAIAATGSAGTRGLFVLLQSPALRDVLAVARPAAASWQELPSPPEGTSTVAFTPSGSVQSLVGAGERLSVWTLDDGGGSPASARWVRGQVLHVTIEYGSSSQ